MSEDVYEARIRYYVNVPHVTHRIMCNSKHIGDWWSDGSITIDEDLAGPFAEWETTLGRWADDGGRA